MVGQTVQICRARGEDTRRLALPHQQFHRLWPVHHLEVLRFRKARHCRGGRQVGVGGGAWSGLEAEDFVTRWKQLYSPTQ